MSSTGTNPSATNPSATNPSATNPSATNPSPTATKPSATKPSSIASGDPPILSADPALEAFLPSSVLGVTRQRFSIEGSVFPAGGDLCIIVCPGEPGQFAAALGVPIEAITIAATMSDNKALVAIAYRAHGVETDRLIPARRAIGGATGASTPGYLTELRIAGRNVSFIWWPVWENGEYLVVKDDVLVIFFGPRPAEDGSVPAYIEGEIAGLPG